MPIKPNEVAMVNHQIVQKVIDKIDANLSDVAWAREEVREGESNPHWMVVGGGELNESERAVVESIYMKADWGTVRVRNSSMTGEKPGLWSVTLYKFKQYD